MKAYIVMNRRCKDMVHKASNFFDDSPMNYVKDYILADNENEAVEIAINRLSDRERSNGFECTVYESDDGVAMAVYDKDGSIIKCYYDFSAGSNFEIT